MTNAPPLVHIHLQRQAKGDSSNLLFYAPMVVLRRAAWKRFFSGSMTIGFSYQTEGRFLTNLFRNFNHEDSPRD